MALTGTIDSYIASGLVTSLSVEEFNNHLDEGFNGCKPDYFVREDGRCMFIWSSGFCNLYLVVSDKVEYFVDN